MEIEFVAIVRERSGGISLARARLVLPLSRKTVDAPDSKGRAAKAKATGYGRRLPLSNRHYAQ